jgi:DNA modification methylase
VIQEDARNTKDKVLEESVDLAITSPPYADLKDYGYDEQIGHGQSDEEYFEDLEEVFEGVHRALKDKGSFWLIIDTFKRKGDVQLLPFEVADRLKDIGFTLKDVIIWDKKRTLPWTNKGEMRNVFEYIMVFSKGEEMKHEVNRIKNPKDLKKWWVKYPERYNPKGKTPSNIWEFSNRWEFDIPTQGAWSDDSVRHACPFSPRLVERIISLTTDEEDTVFDPFAGTGTVPAQAKAMGRKAFGFELNEDYIREKKEKIKPRIKDQ